MVSTQPLVRGKDWGYFALMTLLAVGGYLGCVFALYAVYSLR
jgi:hypothetical protein